MFRQMTLSECFLCYTYFRQQATEYIYCTLVTSGSPANIHFVWKFGYTENRWLWFHLPSKYTNIICEFQWKDAIFQLHKQHASIRSYVIWVTFHHAYRFSTSCGQSMSLKEINEGKIWWNPRLIMFSRMVSKKMTCNVYIYEKLKCEYDTQFGVIFRDW